MAHITADRVRDTTTTTGTGALTVSGSAPSGYNTFSGVLSTGDTFYYAVQHQAASEWEVGLGTYSSANTITRTTVYSSSNAGSAVNFSSGTKDIFITLAASRTVQKDAAGNITGLVVGTNVQAWDADLDAIAALAGTSGFLKKTAANTWSLDTNTYLTSAVTGVTGTAPIVSSGGTAPAISISAATTVAAGSMSAADKAKLDGIATGATANTGTVTSVGGTGTVSGLTLSGTVTSTGNLTLGGTLAVTPSNFSSQTANVILAAPNGAAGVPTFRALVAADIPTLNQNTTGTAANVSGTVAVANGGTGSTTAANARTALGLVIGTNVQAWDADLDTWATKTAPSGTVVGTTDTQTLSGKTVTGLRETRTAPTISSGTLTLDCSAGNVFNVTLNANITTLTFTNVPSSGTAFGLTLLLTADGTARTITWGASVKWPGGTAPTLTSTNAKVDTFVLFTHDGGTTWYAFTGGQNA